MNVAVLGCQSDSSKSVVQDSWGAVAPPAPMLATALVMDEVVKARKHRSKILWVFVQNEWE